LPGSCFSAFGFFVNHFLSKRIPLAARRAFARPFGTFITTFITEKSRLYFTHIANLHFWEQQQGCINGIMIARAQKKDRM
jgi:hypothetical protein